MGLRLACILFLTLFTGCIKTEIPGYGSKRPAIYIVQQGDTLYQISRRFGMDYRILAKRNHLRPPYTIYPGQRLYLSGQAPPPRYLPMTKSRTKPHARQRSRKAKAKVNKQRQVMKIAKKKRITHERIRLQWPLAGKLLHRFGRIGNRLHDGIDIAAPAGTPIRAAADGQVVYDRQLGGYGRLIILRHRRDLFTAYAHNQRNLVRTGQKVKQGDIIAYVGKSGTARVPHLHFEVRRGPTPVDPLAYLPKR